jgi:hypothetical protein
VSKLHFVTSRTVPTTLETLHFTLRPLRTTDVELDYEAVMASRAMLRRWSQSDWPADDFTLEGNLADLDRHQREHEVGQAFTYTVMNPPGDRCLGCVYINPLFPALAQTGICDLQDEKTAVSLRFWGRTSPNVSDLEQQLLSALQNWFKTEWPVDCLVFVTSQALHEQQSLWEANGLTRRDSYTESGRIWLAYRPETTRTMG